MRKVFGVSHQTLVKSIGVTYQQIHKYERAENRVSAAMLVRICQSLKIAPWRLSVPIFTRASE